MVKILQQKGVILIITSLTLGILLLLGSYFLTFALTESKISKSQKVGTQTYYLAEAGIAEAIWRLKNDSTWKNNFEDEYLNPDLEGKYWQASFSREGLGGSYSVTIQNSARARGEITATSTIVFPDGKTAQRVIKTTIFKSLASPTEDSGIFSGGSSENIDINYTYLRINNGNLFSNHNLDIKKESIVEVYDDPDTRTILEGQVLVDGNLNVDSSTLDNCEVRCSKNECGQCLNHQRNKKCKQCPADSASTPLVDFDSDGPYSFKSRAQETENAGQCEALCNGAPCTVSCNGTLCMDKCILTASEFEELLWEVGASGTLTLNNDITYVTGPIELKGGRHLIVNGALAADDNIAIGEKRCWTKRGQKDCGSSQLTINQPTPTTPSGLLTKRKIDFSLYSSFSDISVSGVIYANDELRLVSVPNTFNVVGGIIARKLALTSLGQWLNVTLDNDKILRGLGYKIDDTLIDPTYSPIVTIDHWEESY